MFHANLTFYTYFIGVIVAKLIELGTFFTSLQRKMLMIE